MPPSSNQNPLGNSKAAKFAAQNPLAPLADPFSGIDGGDDAGAELRSEVSNNVQERLTKAMAELKAKHDAGTAERDDPERAPTGSAYRTVYEEQKALAARGRAANDQRRREEDGRAAAMKEAARRMKFAGGGENNGGGGDGNDSDGSDGSDDGEYDGLLDDVPDDLQAIRLARLAQMKAAQSERARHISLGHGSLRTIREDEFLAECTGSSRWVCVHFYSDDFQRCKIMDHHLGIVAGRHLTCKFLRMDASKAPFFVTKFRIKSLPALFLYDGGKEVGRLAGFDGLAKNPNKPDEWDTGRLEEWLAGVGAIEYERPSEEVVEEMRRMGLVQRGSVYSERERRGGHWDDEY